MGVCDRNDAQDWCQNVLVFGLMILYYLQANSFQLNEQGAPAYLALLSRLISTNV
jgi:hypothetical protein